MTFREAKKLNIGDSVRVKWNPEEMVVTYVDIDKARNEVFVQCDGGNWFHHRTLVEYEGLCRD